MHQKRIAKLLNRNHERRTDFKTTLERLAFRTERTRKSQAISKNVKHLPKTTETMKTLLFITLFTASLSLSAQLTTDANGNFIHTKKATATVDSLTAKTYTDHNGVTEKVYSVSKTEPRAYYVPRISTKSGKYYRRYLKAE